MHSPRRTADRRSTERHPDQRARSMAMASQTWRRRIGRAARGWLRPSRLMLLAAAALLSGVAVVSAQTAPSSPPPTITVSGQATASQPPDTATIFGSVVSDADTPAAATNANSQALTAVINA